MVAGATRKVKQPQAKPIEADLSAGQARPPEVRARGRAPKAAAIAPKKTTARKKSAAPAKATAKSKAGPSVEPPTKARTKPKPKSKSRTGTPRRGSKTTDADVLAMLKEQNEALGAELEQAQQRIRELEDLNKAVVNRIDWVVDSLQDLLTKR